MPARLAGAVLAALLAAAPPAAAQAPVVAAAADLRFALPEVAAAFALDTGERVRLSFGSSGNFARQIRQGAPYEVFLSADEGYVLALAADGFTRDRGTLYAIGRLALVVPEGSPLAVDGSLGDLAAALDDGRLGRLAIANPAHAPYGRAAEEALRHAGVWPRIRPHLVLGENVAQAAQFALEGGAAGGLVAYSLALAPQVAAAGARIALVPAAYHAPLRQRIVLVAGAGAVAERFYAFVRGPAARRTLRAYGFTLPGES